MNDATSVRALVCSGPDAEPELVDIMLPELRPDEVRVRVHAAGVCHSDLSMINGTLAPDFPLVLGHEAAGEVTAVGAAATAVKPGDHVVLAWATPCRKCWFCQHNEPWLCERTGSASAPRGTTVDGTPLHVTLGVGAFAEEVVVNESAAIPVPVGLPLDQGALLGCAVLTGFGAVKNAAGVAQGDTVAVIGVGGVGLSVIAAARAANAHKIIAVDLSPAKAELAHAMGATEFIVSDESAPKRLRALTDGRGVDHAFECVGRSATITAAWRSTRRGGQVTVVGMGAKDDLVKLGALDIYHSGRILRAASYSCSDPNVQIPLLAAAVLDGSLDLRPLITHRITLAEATEALNRLRVGEGARSVVVFAH
jgi:S-(hydroxymethyl)glutathione dehydrogenase / alcohol dehydrogenase